MYFAMFKWNSCYFKLCPLPLACSLEKVWVHLLFTLPSSKLCIWIRSPLHFLLSRVTSLISLSVSSHDRCFNHFIIFMAFLWSCSSSSKTLLYQKAQSWTQHSSCSRISAEQRGRITSLYLLVMLFLMQPMMLLTLFATLLTHGQLGVCQDPQFFSAKPT